MQTVRQLVNSKAHRLLSIQPDNTIYDALRKMSEHDVGALIVLQDKKLVGIFSERDYARKVILEGKTSKQTLISEIMTKQVICVSPDRTADECMALMTEKRVRHLPVIENKLVVALISIGDVVREMISDQKQTIAQLEQYIMS
ncbi:MAG: CBS domain-containing protein [Burkholderiales bacterium]|nr:CBS domain-containing protein [Burkholderiales bacterium]MDG1224914.1 CBS domain-containing protein [Burkholderiales bacterium]MDG2203458.1 CBS domain-containing protein [Burkholderiales bacterium]